MKKRISFILKTLRNRRGIALLIAIFAMILTITIAVEVSYETSVGYIQSAQEINRLKAYYAADSGIELSLFRILLYRKVLAQYGQQLSSQRGLLDEIWQLPFAWPLPMTGLSKSVREDINSVIKDSMMDAQYSVTIESESGRIDINALGSGNIALINSTRAQLMLLFQNAIKSDSTFKKKYKDYNFTNLLDNIQDWVSPGNVGVGGRDKSELYKQPEDVHNYRLPPDAPFKTMSELHMVAGMKDDFYNVLKDRVTVYGDMGINVNYANAAVLESIDPQITPEIVKKIEDRIANQQLGGPFQNSNDFYTFLQGLGVNTTIMERNQIPLVFDPAFNFRITSTGTYRNVERTITVVTYDMDMMASREAAVLTQNMQQQMGQQPTTPPGTMPGQPPGTPPGTQPGMVPTNVPPPTGRPRVVMWKEN